MFCGNANDQKHGKGIEFASATSAATVYCNTIVNNTNYGIHSSGTAPTISNCIIWGNDDDLNGCSATYSCIQDGDSGTGNISRDPCFVDPCEPDYHLKWESMCINTGDLCYVSDPSETDIDGDNRKLGGRVDMGADEADTDFRVKNINQGKWYETIQEAIDEADPCDVIVVYPGTYDENVDFGGKAITVRSSDPCDPCTVEATIIDAIDANWWLAYSVRFGEGNSSVLKGFTITGATRTDHVGIYCYRASPVISNCRVIENGGGINCVGSGSPVITNCEVQNNGNSGVKFASNNSGTISNCTISNNTGNGIECNMASPVISNCRVIENGGGINCMYSGSPVINNCEVQNNGNLGIVFDNSNSGTISNCRIIGHSVFGIACDDNASPTITNCNIYDNGYSGVHCQIGAQADITNCTIVNHESSGIWIDGSQCSATVNNCIIWDNGDDLYNCSATYSCIQDIDPGDNNIVGDPNNPLFIDPNDGDYCLGYGSPCIDAANGNVDPPEC
jgi:parallel beta-helix repeat protein